MAPASVAGTTDPASTDPPSTPPHAPRTSPWARCAFTAGAPTQIACALAGFPGGMWQTRTFGPAQVGAAPGAAAKACSSDPDNDSSPTHDDNISADNETAPNNTPFLKSTVPPWRMNHREGTDRAQAHRLESTAFRTLDSCDVDARPVRIQVEVRSARRRPTAALQSPSRTTASSWATPARPIHKR